MDQVAGAFPHFKEGMLLSLTIRVWSLWCGAGAPDHEEEGGRSKQKKKKKKKKKKGGEGQADSR